MLRRCCLLAIAALAAAARHGSANSHTYNALAAAARHGVANSHTYNVLVAGYGPFNNNTDNPAGDVATALDGDCYQLSDLLPGAAGTAGRVCFSGWVLPVTHVGATEVSRALRRGTLQRAGIDAIVHLGLEDSAKGLKIELTAVNQRADSDVGVPIAPAGPAISTITFDLARLDIAEALAPIAALQGDGTSVSETWSNDAGTYVERGRCCCC